MTEEKKKRGRPKKDAEGKAKEKSRIKFKTIKEYNKNAEIKKNLPGKNLIQVDMELLKRAAKSGLMDKDICNLLGMKKSKFYDCKATVLEFSEIIKKERASDTLEKLEMLNSMAKSNEKSSVSALIYMLKVRGYLDNGITNLDFITDNIKNFHDRKEREINDVSDEMSGSNLQEIYSSLLKQDEK